MEVEHGLWKHPIPLKQGVILLLRIEYSLTLVLARVLSHHSAGQLSVSSHLAPHCWSETVVRISSGSEVGRVKSSDIKN